MAGVWVSAHPDVILRMGTKEVLVDTASMSWGTETRLYRTPAELREQLPSRLADGVPRVLKQHRGMGGKRSLEGRGRRYRLRKGATCDAGEPPPSGLRWVSSSRAASRTSPEPG